MQEIPYNDHRSFNNPSVWIPLFDIQLAEDNVQHLTPSLQAITADGFEYQPFPVTIDEFSDDGKGSVNTVAMTVSNITGTLSTAIKQNPDVDGQPITFKVWSVEKQAVVWEETQEILKVGPLTDTTITFELGMFNPFLARLLSEKFLRDFCWNRYKGRGCWFKTSTGFSSPPGFTVGSPDSCTRKLSDCDRHTNTLRFNSFPGIPGGGGFV